MSAAFVKIDLHGMTQDEAIRVIDKAIAIERTGITGRSGHTGICEYGFSGEDKT